MTDVLFFVSPIGLGHAARDVAVSELLQNLSIRFVTGLGAARLIGEYGFDVLDRYNPPGFDVRDGRLRHSVRWLWKYYRYYKNCRTAAAEIIRGERPKIIVSDEDFASLAEARQAGIPGVLVTDILETRFAGGIASALERRMNRSMQGIMSGCSAVILPEQGQDAGNIRYAGPIVRRTQKSREQLRESFGFDKYTILASAGGTDAGAFLLERAAQAAEEFDADLVTVSGPQLKHAGSKSLGFLRDMHEAVCAADLIISLAGRSTIDEAHYYGTPGIFIPIKGHFEQEDNAAREGFSFADLDRLPDLIRAKMGERRNPRPAGGAARAAEIISSVLRSNN